MKQGEHRLLLEEHFAFPECLRVNEEAREILEKGDSLIIDFSRCTHLDSSALGVLFSLRRNLPADSSQLKIANLNQHVTRILSAYKLDNFFEIIED